MIIPLTRGKKTNANAQYVDSLMENFTVTIESTPQADGYLSTHKGLLLVDTIDGKSRGAVWNDRFNMGFRVNGNRLWSINSSGEAVDNIGFIGGSGYVSMPFSFNTQAVITQNGRMYLYSLTDGFREITDPDLGAIFDGTWIDGYYFMVDSESPVVTDLLAENSIRPLNYGSAEIEPDPIRGCSKWRNFGVVFGSTTMEFYENVGGTNFPFQRIESYTIYVGIVGRDAKCKLPEDKGFIILGGGKDKLVDFMFAVNGSARSISNNEVKNILKSYTEEELSTAKLEYVLYNSNDVVYAHLPRHTLMYDFTSSSALQNAQWSIIKTGWANQNNNKGYWQAVNVVKLPSNNYSWGNRDNGKFYVYDEATPMQDGEQQEHICYSPLMRVKGSISKFQPQTISGNAAIGRDESCFLSATQDGQSYSDEAALDIADRGERLKQIIWRALGFYRNWFGFKLRYVGKTTLTLSGAEINGE